MSGCVITTRRIKIEIEYPLRDHEAGLV
jgi:hypothetical protein